MKRRRMMKKELIVKSIKIMIILFGALYIWYIAPHSMVWAGFKTAFIDATKKLAIQEGDFIFQDVNSQLFQVIKDVTESPLTHCGIIVKEKGRWFVLEAIGPVKLTPLNAWIHRGIGSETAIVRMKESYRTIIPNMIKSAHIYMNRPYDIQYEWDDEKIYCSELIYKAVWNVNGLKLAPFRKLGDMRWQLQEEFIRKVDGGGLPLEREMITPVDLFHSDKVEVVHNNFMEKITAVQIN
jgi:hypothetical protein